VARAFALYLERLALPARLRSLLARLAPILKRARPGPRTRLAALVVSGAAALVLAGAVGYELARERVPEHRAALESLVRSYTGLDVRFRELGLRWGWYGPEAVFRQVELGEPGRPRPLLAAPELIVSFDLWSTLRRGDLAAARITLLSPDIDLEEGQPARPSPPARSRAPQAAPASRVRQRPADGRLALLARWRGGRVDIEGGTIRLADPAGPGSLSLQIRSASLRRAESRWSAVGDFFLPERLGRSARLVLQLTGDPARPATLGGQLRFEGSRLRLPGWREILAGTPATQRYLPVEGAGDIELTARFARGELVGGSGRVRLAGLTLLEPSPVPAAHVRHGRPPATGRDAGALQLARLRGQWRLARQADLWSLQVEGLELGEGAPAAPARLTLTAAARLDRVQGHLQGAPLGPVLDIAGWAAPQLRLPGVELGGDVRALSFDWDAARPPGHALQTAATLEGVSLQPSSHAFALGGVSLQVSGTDGELIAQGESQAGSLRVADAPEHPLTGLHVSQELRVRRSGTRWEITVARLTLENERTRLSLHGSVAGDLDGRPAQIAAQGVLTGADVPMLLQLTGQSTVRAFGAAASHLTAGRIEDAQLVLRGPLDQSLLLADPGGFTGTLTLRDGVLSGGDLWPDAQGVTARVDWRGADIHAQLLEGHAGHFGFESGQARWNALGKDATHVSGRVRGRLQDVIAWLRGHPGLAVHAPQVQDLDLAGNAQLDLDVRIPPPDSEAGSAGATPRIQAQVVAVLDQGQMQPIAGLPAIHDLHGSLSLRDGHLARSTLSGRWLGGPVTLRLAQVTEHGVPALSIDGHGELDAAQFTVGSGVPGESLAGTSEWSGELGFVAAHGHVPAQWRASAEASLAGVASTLPEPLAKPPGSPVPLRVAAQGSGDRATLRISLGDRLRSVLALRRQAGKASGPTPGPDWLIERGGVQLGTSPAALPREAELRFTGRAARLELPPYLALWQQLRRDAVTPVVRAQLTAAEFLVAGQRCAQPAGARVLLERRDGRDVLTLESSCVSGEAHWPVGDAAPAEVHLGRLTLPDVATSGAGAAVVAALGPAARVKVQDLVWSGRSLGALSGNLTARLPQGGTPASLDIEDIQLAGSTQQAQGSLRCSSQCRLQVQLTTQDAAASLRDFGFRPELSAQRGTLSGDLSWPLDERVPLLAALQGTVSLALEDGSTTTPEGAAAQGVPFPLLAPAALVAGANPPGGPPRDADGAPAPPQPLRFTRLAGDFELGDGQARTTNLHFDGDAEILVRGRLGLLRRDYDQQVWILGGEERLPAAVRRLGPTQGMAAVWLSLRALISDRHDRSRAALHLQGSWDDPIVSPE
jgi:uncharacterized protein YhdP